MKVTVYLIKIVLYLFLLISHFSDIGTYLHFLMFSEILKNGIFTIIILFSILDPENATSRQFLDPEIGQKLPAHSRLQLIGEDRQMKDGRHTESSMEAAQ